MPEPATWPPRLPAWTLALTAGVSALCILSGLGLSAVAVAVAPRPVWVVFGPGILIALAGVIGVLFGRGRFQDGQGLALACVAGTLALSAALLFLGTRQGVALFSERAVSLKWAVLATLAASGVVGALACYAVFRRDPRCRAYAVRAALAGGGTLAVLAGAWFGRGVLSGLGQAVELIILCLAGVVAMVLFCAAGHCAIRAFESGRLPDTPPGPAPPPA